MMKDRGARVKGLNTGGMVNMKEFFGKTENEVRLLQCTGGVVFWEVCVEDR